MSTKTKSKNITGLHLLTAFIFLLFAGQIALAALPIQSKETKTVKQEKVKKNVTPKKLQEKQPRVSPTINYEKVILNDKLLKQRIQNLSIALDPRYTSLKKILSESEKILDETNTSLLKVTTLQKENTIHSLIHEDIEAKVLFVEKMVMLPATIKEIENLIIQNKNEIAKLKSNKNIYTLIKSYEDELNKLQKNLDKLKIIQKSYDFNKINDQTRIIRNQTGTILQMRKIWFGQKDIQQIIKNLEAYQKRLLGVLQLKLPNGFHIEDFHPQLAQNDRDVKVVVCMNTFGIDQPLLTREEIQSEIDVVNNYYQENSLQNTQVELVNVVEVNEDWSQLLNARDDYFGEFNLALAACDPLIDFTEIDAFIVYPSKTVISGRGGPQPGTATQEGLKNLGVVWVAPEFGIINSFSVTLMHEIGHSNYKVGSWHAKSADCSNSIFLNGFMGCNLLEYGNSFDVMGSNFRKGHFSGWHKYLNNWVRLQDVRNDGDYTIGVLENPSAQPQVLRIPFRDHPLCIEYRKPIGFDEFNSENQFHGQYEGAGIPVNGGLLINVCQRATPENAGYEHVLLDATPHDYGNADDINIQNLNHVDNMTTFIRQRENFNSPELGLSLNWEIQDDNSILVHIDIDENTPMSN